MFQCASLRRLVFRQRNSWRTAIERRQLKRPRLGWYHYYRSCNLHRHPFWLQGRSRLRVLVLDPLLYYFPNCDRRIRTLRLVLQYPHGRRLFRSRLCS